MLVEFEFDTLAWHDLVLAAEYAEQGSHKISLEIETDGDRAYLKSRVGEDMWMPSRWAVSAWSSRT